MKSLYDISLKISESEYRADPALSYSTLAKFEREGFNKISSLFTPISTPSLTLGSAVDILITGGREEFDANFIVAEFPKISDTLVNIVNSLFNEFSDTHINLIDIPDIEVSGRAKLLDFWAGDKWNKVRAKKVKEDVGCQEYYKLLYIAQGKTVLNTDTYQDVINMVDSLKTSEATSFYFQENNPFDNIERLYQLKFKDTLNDINYRCMMDLAIVNHNEKWVLPCDLKTSGHEEYSFYQSFKTWRYDIQARLYWRLLRTIMDKDDYFKDFTLLDYKFIVVNRKNLDPMVWDFPVTKAKGTLEFKDGTIMRDPEDIGKELSYYLSSRPKRPIGIENENNIVEWLNKV